MSGGRVCFLTVDSIDEGVGRSQILPTLREVAGLGWSVHLVTFNKSLRSNEPVGSIRDGIEVTSVPFGNRGVGPGAWRVARLAKAIPPADVYHSRSDLPYLAASLRRKRPVIWDCRSLWAEQRAAAGSLSRSSPAFRALSQLERRACTQADGLITLSHAAARSLLAKWGKLPKQRRVISTVADLDHFRLAPVPDLGLIRAGLSGTFGPNYDLALAEAFLSAFAATSADGASLEVLWTSGAEGMSATPSQLPFPTIRLTTDYADLPAVISSCHFGLVPIRLDTGVSATAMMPTKVGEFWASGRPIVVTRGVGDLDEMITRHRVGVILGSSDASEMRTRAIELHELLRDPDLPARCRRVAEEHFDLHKGVRQLMSLYESVL